MDSMDVSKVSRTSSTSAAGKSSGPKRTGDTTFQDMLSVEEAEEAAPAQAVTSVGGIGTLLLAQETGDALEGRQKNKKRANDMLDKLEALRVRILEGSVPESELRALANMTAAERAQMDDPHLAALLDDIELRVAVELAKLGLA